MVIGFFFPAHSATCIWAQGRLALEGTKVTVFTKYDEVKEEKELRIYEKK